MTTLSINGKKVKVSDDFLTMSPEDQNKTVEEIAKSLGVAQPQTPPVELPKAPEGPQGSPAMRSGLSALSEMTQNPSTPDDELAAFEAANPELKGRFTAQNMPKAGEAVPFGGSAKSGGARYTVKDWKAKTVFDERTGMNLPEKVTLPDGTTAYLDPATSTYSTRGMMAEGMQPSGFEAFQAGASQGVTMGFGDEIAGALLGERTAERSRAMVDASRRDRPGMTMTGEIAGALSVPVPVKGGGTLKEVVKEGAKLGAKLGAVYGAGTAEGGAMDRITGGLEGAVSGGLFGAAAPLAVNFGTKAFRRVFKASAERPSIESLRAAKTVAYDAVDKSGERFGPDDLKALSDAAAARMDDLNYLPEVDANTAGLLKKLDILSAKELTIGQVDKFRQAVWKRYNASKEEGLLEIIDSIDEMVAARTSTSELLDAARLANSRFKKAELLDLAFQKAKDQTASTGSGGNVLNKMKQAVTSIINNPKQAKWFSQGEIAQMRAFVEGTTAQNLGRLVGKLSPSGNGLMTALNLGAVSANPAMLGVSALAAGAKALSDNAVERGAQRLIGVVGGGSSAVPPPPVRTAGRLNALAGPISGN